MDGYGPLTGDRPRQTTPAHQPDTDPSGPDGAGSPVGLAGTLLLVIGLALLLPTLIVTTVPDEGRSRAWTLTLVVTVWAGLRLARLTTDGRAQFFQFFFWLYVYLFLGVAPTIQIRADAVSTTTPGMDPALDRVAAVMVLVGLVCYEIGNTVARSRASRLTSGAPLVPPPAVSTTPVQVVPLQPSPLAPPSATSAPPPAYPPALVPAPVDPARGGGHGAAVRHSVGPLQTSLLAAVGVLAAAYYVSQLGAAAFSTSREAGNLAKQAIWPDPVIRSIVTSTAVYTNLVAAGALVQLRRTVSPAWRGAATVALGLTMTLVAIIVNPLSSARYTFGTVAFALVVYLGATRTARRRRWVMGGTVVGFFLLFPLGNAFRRIGEARAESNGLLDTYKYHPDYDGFWQIANAYSAWQDGVTEPLRQITGSFLFWVPREIWPDKPTDTGILLADYRGYDFTNLSAPMWAEAYINAGALGLVVVFLALGYALVRFDAVAARALQRPGAWAIAGAIYPVYLVILLRGSLLQASGAVAVSLACLLFVRRGSAVPPAGRPAEPYRPQAP